MNIPVFKIPKKIGKGLLFVDKSGDIPCCGMGHILKQLEAVNTVKRGRRLLFNISTPKARLAYYEENDLAEEDDRPEIMKSFLDELGWRYED